jgi:hypothetical protein
MVNRTSLAGWLTRPSVAELSGSPPYIITLRKKVAYQTIAYNIIITHDFSLL